MNSDLEEKLRELRKGYINKLRETFSSFKALLNNEPINIQEVYSKVHTISGTSGMYGIKELSDISTEFEFYLKPFRENPASINTKELKTRFSDYLGLVEIVISIGE